MQIKKWNLSWVELEKIIQDSEDGNTNTINLSGIKSTKKRIAIRRRLKFLRNLLWLWILLWSFWLLFIILSFILIKEPKVNATETVVIQKQITTEVEKSFTSIKEILNLEWCRTTQTEEQHILDKWGHVYAMDIACTKWQSFYIKAPLWKDVYKVEEIWYDKKMWNYIVLKHWEYRFVYWHSKTIDNNRIQVWDVINPLEVIWEVDKSWVSEWYHLHFELWKNDYNVSYKEMLWEDTNYNMQYTYELRKQRSWYVWLHDAMKFLSDLEWFRSCPYWDNIRWSIGYGTISKANAKCITKEQAIELKKWNVDDVLRSVYQNHFVPYHNQRIALTSMLYNRGINSRIANIKYRHTEKWIRSYVKEFIRNNTDKKYVKWITKRHNLEVDLYLNKN